MVTSDFDGNYEVWIACPSVAPHNNPMSSLLFAISAVLRNLAAREEGQDLVEYALVMTVIALGSVTGMGSLASAIDNVFSAVTTTLSTNI